MDEREAIVIARSSVVVGPEMEERTVGAVFLREELASPGLTLFSAHKSTYLIDLDGRVVHEWRSSRRIFVAYLLESGNLVRDGNEVELAPQFQTGGAAGYVEVVTWTNQVVWWWSAEPRSERLSHHDVEPISDGRVLVLCWERVRRDRCVSEGRLPELLPDGELWDNLVVELSPPYESFEGVTLDNAPKSSRPWDLLRATETWRFSQFDRLVQDVDPTKKNYGDVSQRLDAYDVNLAPVGGKARARNSVKPGQTMSTGLAVFDPDWKLGKTGEKDWLHANSVSYDDERALVLISYCVPSEVVIVSRRTGDIVFRFGNPFACRRGDVYDDRVLYLQHSAQFVSSTPLRFALFNNGCAPKRQWSTIDEFEIKADDLGAELPAAKKKPSTQVETRCDLVWRHGKPVGHAGSFYAHHSSGIHRCPNGNTLVCLGPQGILFEVTSDHQEVWRYISPVEIRLAAEAPAFCRQGDHRGPGSFSLFFARRYAPDYPAFRNRILTPGPHLEAS
ncbi:hypothetical protein CTAYLR_002196 [Chrysophaeum taylorii]|uniref:Uncharacterized protein n=1 Tax=Chrysophaeum taylorii TaxID=2483200 RepID=A0AAD7XRM6_9STRA|nr:hypothetical protein CTAYLR_002196 [Chrysophaeum taylorii]